MIQLRLSEITRRKSFFGLSRDYLCASITFLSWHSIQVLPLASKYQQHFVTLRCSQNDWFNVEEQTLLLLDISLDFSCFCVNLSPSEKVRCKSEKQQMKNSQFPTGFWFDKISSHFYHLHPHCARLVANSLLCRDVYFVINPITPIFVPN